jgi:hypothetical protein
MPARKIIIHKNSTTFYFPKNEGKKLKAELNKISVLRDYILEWHGNRHLIKYKLSDEQRSDILSKFHTEEKVVENNKLIIKGFTGCLITGHKLKWISK